jgi:hypothetical protein
MQFDNFEGACTITLHTSNLILENTYERRLLLERSSPTTAANLLNFSFFLLITFLPPFPRAHQFNRLTL